MWNKLFGCVSQTLEISSAEEKSKSSLRNSLNNLTNGSYTNLTTNPETDPLKQQVLKLANQSMGDKKHSQTSTTITMASTNMNGSASKKKLVNDETSITPQFSRRQNEAYAKTAGFINASSKYGQFLIVICLVLFTAEIRTSLPLHYFEAFFFYLYSVSILFHGN